MRILSKRTIFCCIKNWKGEKNKGPVEEKILGYNSVGEYMFGRPRSSFPRWSACQDLFYQIGPISIPFRTLNAGSGQTRYPP